MSYLLDVLLLMMLVFEMTFFYLPPVLHEAVGVALLLPIVWHLVRNRRYVSSLGRGRWNGPRGVRFALNVLLASACLVTVISGCLTSSVLFADVVPFSLRSNPSLYQLHSAAARYFVVLAGLHLSWHLPTWWQRWLLAAGIKSRPLQDRLIERLQGAHLFMAPALSYSGAGYALTQVGILIVFAEIGWLLSLWKGVRLK